MKKNIRFKVKKQLKLQDESELCANYGGHSFITRTATCKHNHCLYCDICQSINDCGRRK